MLAHVPTCANPRATACRDSLKMSSTELNRNVLTFPLEWNPHSAARERPVEGHLMMSAKERRHMLACVRVRDHGMSLERAAEAAGLGYRQMRRTWTRFLEAGEAGLIHLSRGRSSSRTTLPSLKEEILERYRLTYLGFGPTLAAEKLACEGLIVDHETLRRWLIASGQHTPRPSRPRAPAGAVRSAGSRSAPR